MSKFIAKLKEESIKEAVNNHNNHYDSFFDVKDELIDYMSEEGYFRDQYTIYEIKELK